MNECYTSSAPFLARSLFRHRRRRDVLRALLIPLDLGAYRVRARRLHEHASVVEVGDEKFSLGGGEVVQVEDVLLERDVGGDQDAVHGGDHDGGAGGAARESASASAASRVPVAWDRSRALELQ